MVAAASTTAGRAGRWAPVRASAPGRAVATRIRPERLAALANHGDRLLAGVGVAVVRTKQFGGPRARTHLDGDQRSISMRAELGERLVKLLVRDTARHLPDAPGPIQLRALVADQIHWAVVRVDPSALPDLRARIDHRPGARVPMKVIEAAEHGLAVTARPRRVLVARARFASHRVRSRRHRATAGLVGDLDPTGEVPDFNPCHLLPRDIDRPEESEPPQHVHPVRLLCRRWPPDRLQVLQVHRDWATASPTRSSSRYGSHPSPVSTSEPTRDSINYVRSRLASSLSITGRDHSHPDRRPSCELRNPPR